MPMTPEERTRLEALSIPCQEKILAQRVAAHRVRIELGLGEFQPIAGNQTLKGCVVSWRNEAGEMASETDCTVVVYGMLATVYLPNLGRIQRRLGAPGFTIIRESAK